MSYRSILVLAVISVLLFSGCSPGQPVKVVAHRGGSNLAPENTLAAFKKAMELGVDMIEIDVAQTIDSVVIVLHDDRVDRTTNGTGRIDSLPFDRVKALDAGSWFSEQYKNERIPTLDEVLELVNGQVILLIEIKGGSEQFPGIERRTVEAVKAFNAVPWTIIQSFNEKAVERVNILDAEIKTYYLLGGNFREYYRQFRNTTGKPFLPEYGYDGLGVHYKLLTAGSIDSIQHAGLEVFTWTVNDVPDMTGMINAGVDGIITDSPDKLIGLIR